MEVLLLIIRLVLGATFGLAAIAKMFDPDGSKKALSDFGVPKALVSPFAFILPVVELAIAGSLLFISSSWYGAICSAAVMLVFIAAMGYQMAKGNAPDCHCFGQIHSEPVGVASILRNAALFALAAFLVYQGKNSQGQALITSNQDVMTFVLGIAVVVLLVAVVMYLKTISEQQVQIMRRIELMELVARDGGHVERDDAGHPHDGLPIGAEFPQFELPDLAGNTVSLADLRADALPVLFFFVSPTCTPCAALVPEFDEWQADLAGKARMVFVTNGKADDNKEKFGEDRLILLQNERELSELLKAQWTPTAVLMDASGRIASHVAAGDTAIRQLVGQIKSHDLKQEFTYFSNGNGHDHGIHIGHEIPSFSLKDLKGNEITADRFRGKRTLVAFWSLSCPFCLEMMDDLREWDETKGADEPELIVFSDGDPAAHEELGLASPIVIDKGHKTSAAFGMSGTPSAVLVGEQGKIISETAIGAPNIWSLLGKKK